MIPRVFGKSDDCDEIDTVYDIPVIPFLRDIEYEYVSMVNCRSDIGVHPPAPHFRVSLCCVEIFTKPSSVHININVLSNGDIDGRTT